MDLGFGSYPSRAKLSLRPFGRSREREDVAFAAGDQRRNVGAPHVERTTPLSQIDSLVVDASYTSLMAAHMIYDRFDNMRLGKAALMQVRDNRSADVV